MSRRISFLVLLWSLAGAYPSSAQAVSPPDSLIRNLDYLSGLLTSELITSLKESIASQVSTYPAGTSSGGFTYGFEPSLGIVTRSTRSFGPAFAERALTLGQYKISASVNFQHVTFDRFEGLDLTNLPLFPGGSTLRMNLKADTTTFVVQTGILPTLDVGVMVPITRVHMAAGIYINDVLIGYGGDGSAAGLGDVVIKTKYSFRQAGSRGLAVSAELSLPTGDEFNFRGAGHSRLKLLAVGSTEAGMFAPHLNLGLTLPARPLLTHGAFPFAKVAAGPEEFNYSGGVDVIAGSSVTIITDLVGRTRRHAFRFGYSTDPIRQVTSFGPINDGDAMLTQVMGSVGLKLNVRGGLLLTTSTLIPLTRGGLSSRVSSVLGFEYAF